MIWAVLRLLRPKQWIKNVLVGAAPLAAGELLEPGVASQTLRAFAVFALASSATYCLNDVLDAGADALHPVKRSRPVASGLVRPWVALTLAAALAAGALVLASPAPLRWAVTSYLGLTVLYCTGLKHKPVLELGLVAGGFIVRAVGGGAATQIPLSKWFLIVTAFASMFMVAGKRLSELAAESQPVPMVRRSLTFYPLSYLRMILSVSAGVTITGYCLWAFEVGAAHSGGLWTAISVGPFVLAILRYALDTDQGRAEEPEEVVLRDPTLQALGALWLLTFSAGIFL
ncbi:decaprenyl-phosphate phosphoribosyltransferase [Knoellia sp. 3-2P3]|uniref:decaprenyl-phosphate phosphoribosyltransferase n=1 Tax=unclassified Knoellia TaxID=2618719 RepID=UPI0023D9F9BF|nr:decaprenyl-phosphate phosphoribosyltransferase [Knoellia sp. 3-2P3]MDF2093107.1 decaprenyl-phosphate phosphoribosyltransferase [Knoellia sp. 3-2P3]